MDQRGPRRSVVTIGLWCGLLMITAAVASVSTNQSTPQPSPNSKAAQDRALLTRMCIMCHDLGLATDNWHTRREWNGVLENMLGRGAMWTDDEYNLVLDVLTRNYGLVQINKADAAEIAMVMGLTDKDGAAIVTYRTAHGPFADVDTLAKVPDVDQKKIRGASETLIF